MTGCAEHSEAGLSVGWIGTGRMGFAMAGRLARAGAAPPCGTGRAPRPNRWQTWAARSSTPWSLRDRDVVFTMVSTPADLEQVLVGDHGLLAGDGPLPGVVVDCSTVSTESSGAMRAACEAAASVSSPAR